MHFLFHNEKFQTMCENTVVNISDSQNHLLIRIKSIKDQTEWDAKNLKPNLDPSTAEQSEPGPVGTPR